MTSPDSCFSAAVIQVVSARARRRLSTTLPASFSGESTYTLTSSPGCSSGSSPRKPSSLLEITPSALKPMSTRTSSASTRTTTPSTMSPGTGVLKASSSRKR